jgi:hypothetical protein
MNKTSRPTPATARIKLSLRRASLRELNRADLSGVAGGWGDSKLDNVPTGCGMVDSGECHQF